MQVTNAPPPPKTYAASEVTNDSTVTGANVDDALDTLDAGKQPLDSDLTAIAALTTTAAGRSLLVLADPNADRLVMWDDSAGSYQNCTVSTGLTLSGTTIVADAEYIADTVGAMLTGNTETNITVTYQDTDNTIDFAVPAASDSVAGVLEVASQAEQEAGSLTTHAVTPGRQQHHRSAAKAWVTFDVGGGLHGSYNVASVTDNGVGTWTVNIATDFSSTDYAAVVTGGYVVGVSAVTYNVGGTPTAGTYNILAFNSSNTAVDPTNYGPSFVAFGDQ